MARLPLRSLGQWLARVVTQPRSELDRWQRAVRFAYDLGRFGAKQLRYDRAPQMAAALAFRSLFALLPVLVVATIVVRSVIGIDEFMRVVDQLLSAAHLADLQIVLPGRNGHSESLQQWLDTLIGEAASVNLVAVGWVGLVILAYGAISLMVTIENAFNLIYRAPEGRSWTRRVPLYWFVLTMAPVAMGLAAYVNHRFELWIASVDAWQFVLAMARLVWSCFFGWLVLLGTYVMIPNTRVEIRPALVGSFVTVVLFHAGVRSLGAYLQNAFTISQLYGSLGLIPLFMFWVYVMWLILLFGLEVSAILQMLQGRRFAEIEQRPADHLMVDPAIVVTIASLVARNFVHGQTTTAQAIRETTLLPSSLVDRILQALIHRGIFHAVDDEGSAVTVARPLEQISVEQLLEIGFELADMQHEVGPGTFMEQLRAAQREKARAVTLADLVES